jgi:hypothetical protein
VKEPIRFPVWPVLDYTVCGSLNHYPES